jgi:hypothetical protein
MSEPGYPPLFGDPQYPTEWMPPSDPPPPPPPGRGPHPAVWLALGVVLIGALALGGYLLLPSSGPHGVTSVQPAPQRIPSQLAPSVSISTAPANGLISPCSFSPSAEDAAVTYVGMAQFGQTEYAQLCVYHDTVPRSVTAKLQTTDSGRLYSPSGISGSMVRFTSIDGTSHLTVTATKEPDGRYYITKVQTG